MELLLVKLFLGYIKRHQSNIKYDKIIRSYFLQPFPLNDLFEETKFLSMSYIYTLSHILCRKKLVRKRKTENLKSRIFFIGLRFHYNKLIGYQNDHKFNKCLRKNIANYHVQVHIKLLQNIIMNLMTTLFYSPSNADQWNIAPNYSFIRVSDFNVIP